MEERDRHIENFLREFAPKKPTALRQEVQTRAMFQWRLMAAAGIAMVTGTAVWFASRKEVFPRPEVSSKEAKNGPTYVEPKRKNSILMLTKIALDDPQRLDAALAETGRGTLPKLAGNSSTLRVLAKE